MRNTGRFSNRVLTRLTLTSLGLAALLFLNSANSDEPKEPTPTQAPLLLPESESEAAQPRAQFQHRRSKFTRDDTEAGADYRQLLLYKGKDKIVDLDFDIPEKSNGNDDFVSVGNPALVKTQIVSLKGQRRQLLFKALTDSGTTTVILRDEEGVVKLIFNVIVVSARDLQRDLREMKGLLKEVEGIDLRIVGDRIVIDGEVLTPQDFGRLTQVLMGYNSQAVPVLNLVTISPHALTVLAKRIEGEIVGFAPNVRTRVVNGMIFIEGTVDNADQGERIKRLSRLYLPDVKGPSQSTFGGFGAGAAASAQAKEIIQLFLQVNPSPPQKKTDKLVRVYVHFVELNKDFEKYFGFKWEPGFTSDPTIQIGETVKGDVRSAGPSFTATLSSLFPKLKSAQSAGFARVIKTGNVVVKSGEPASIEDTTQVPVVKNSTGNNQVDTPVSFGFNVNVTPRIMGQGEDVNMKINVKQSAPAGRSIGGDMMVSNHTVSTELFVKTNESAAIGAVESAFSGTTYNKMPPYVGTFDDQTSPLFTLQRDKDYNKKRNQFVIFVTPQVLESATEGSEEMKRNFRIRAK